MKKQIILLIMVLTFILSVTGTVSATTTVNTTSSQYQIGQLVTQQALADTDLKLNQSSNNLVITTASTAQYNGSTTEDSVQAVVDETSALSDGQQITYGSGNLLIINQPNGALWFTFVSKIGNTLMAKTFTISSNGDITATKTVNIGISQTTSKFKKAITDLGSNGFKIVNIANLWANGAPADLMALTYTNGAINQGTIDNYAETKSFALQYTTGSNYIITTAGGLDDDAPFYGAFGFNDIFFSTTGPDGETVFINYNTDTNGIRSGVLSLMTGNDLTSQFGTVTAGTLSEINFNLWLLNKLKNSPQDLFTVLEFKNLNEDNIKYLWYDTSLGYGHGIDESYINDLTDFAGGWVGVNNIIPITDYNGMFALGQDAFNYAYNTQHLFTLDDLASGRVAVSLAPYYVNYLGTRSLVGFIDGIVSTAQAVLQAANINAEGFTIDNILSIRNPWMWSTQIPAIFLVASEDSVQAYKNHQGENNAMNYLELNAVKSTYNYNSATGSYDVIRSSLNLSPIEIQKYPQNNFLNGFIIPAPSGLLYAWSAGAPYSYLRTIARVGCICSTKEYDLSTNLMEQYPLGPNEYYILTVLTATGETNRQISGRTTAWGVSPGQGTYYSVGQTSNSAYQLIVTIWNETTQMGRSMLIAYDGNIIAKAMANTGYTNNIYRQEADLFWHLDHGWVDQQDVIASSISTVKTFDNMNQDFLYVLNSAGSDPISYMLNYIPPNVEVDTPSGTYNTGIVVIITSPGSTIYYTTDGTTPTTQSPIYTGPINITETTILQYIAVQGSYISPVYTENYTINEPTPNPTPTTGTSVINAAFTGFAGALIDIYNAITGSTNTNTATNDIAPGLPLGQNTPTSLPIGIILGFIIVAIAAILIYLGRHAIYAAITGSERS
ncbi:MAG: chitobiase/beta-hexosaminidase C-terminal domain-containing protein [Methanobacterium sp.]|nr:chitobiase/beta-hexosaminidase C-terminal domain-containing protein [Methanobacterium sp.]